MIRAFLSLGSNLGDRPRRLRAARKRLAGLADVAQVRHSPLYATDPWGDPNQPDYLNQVVALDLGPSWTPEGLLAAVGVIETAEGRVRDPKRRFGPRTLDVDILLFGSVRLERPELILPHPRLRERAFVLIPLADIAPDAPIADAVGGSVGQALEKLLSQCPEMRQTVRPYTGPDRT